MATDRETIRIDGLYFWRGEDRAPTNNGIPQFFVRGVVYQIPEEGIDVLSDDHLPQLRRDVQLLQELGINTIYVYSLNNTKSHDAAMRLLDDAGIYVLATLSTKHHIIRRVNSSGSYTQATISSLFQTIDAMSRYPNVLGLFVANGTIYSPAHEPALPYLQAAVRDVKRYMRLRHRRTGQRILPIGYAAAETDTASLAALSSRDDATAIDFWATTSYGKDLTDERTQGELLDFVAKGRGIPILLSEYSFSPPRATIDQPRGFDGVAALFAPPLSRRLSGGCVYQFWNLANGYGLVELVPVGGKAESRAYQAALERARDGRKVVERRQVEGIGSLSIFGDFRAYQAQLEATRDVHVRSSNEGSQGALLARLKSEHDQDSRLPVPESCVDWTDSE
ncbi:Glyco-hydro-72 domain containing protein [Teratosphaeria destructans]|uniref:1,3-beta-glucanosyltransferase n=1 Tax=Teratosphaeria destructans TaxID=418781 RepID=A0A9W7SJN3_9PEZI|nr:Glyco-hydro-72 domain containing protein [Teratosphaeria destructans]